MENHGLQLVNDELCIMCQSNDNKDLKRTENCWRRMIEAVSQKLNIVWDRLRNYGISL